MSDPTLQRLLDERDVVQTVVALFVGTDQRDWKRVESCLAERVLLDMTSLVGGAPAELGRAEVAEGWRDGLAVIEHSHHQLGNFEVEVRTDTAVVRCYGTTFHYRNLTYAVRSRTFVGAYEIQLRRSDSRWLIHSFRYDSKFVLGNLELETST